MKTWFLPAAMAVFAVISLVMIASVREDLFSKQLQFFIIGAVIYFAASRVSFTRWLQWRWWLYLGVILLLMLPLLLGQSSRNTSRWIEFGIFRLQPSQLAIPLVGLSSVWLLSPIRLSFKRILLFLASLLPPMILVFISPDLGTTAVFIIVLVSLLWYAGAPLKYLLLLFAVGVVLVMSSWAFLLKPYQRERFATFIVGTQQAGEQHYNATQALIAIGGGMVTGAGWDRGSQSHLQFLPERHTDFIFSSFAEEFGFIGTSLLVVVVLLVTVQLFYFAHQTGDKASALYLFLAAMTLFTQAAVNIGMNIGLLPITGVTLPLISYGGSSVLATCLLFGICGSILANQTGAPPRIIS